MTTGFDRSASRACQRPVPVGALETDPFRAVSRRLRLGTATAALSLLAPESAGNRRFQGISGSFPKIRSSRIAPGRRSSDLAGRATAGIRTRVCTTPGAGCCRSGGRRGAAPMIGVMAWSGVCAVREYVYVAALVALALLTAWRLGRLPAVRPAARSRLPRNRPEGPAAPEPAASGAAWPETGCRRSLPSDRLEAWSTWSDRDYFRRGRETEINEAPGGAQGAELSATCALFGITTRSQRRGASMVEPMFFVYLE